MKTTKDLERLHHEISETMVSLARVLEAIEVELIRREIETDKEPNVE